MDNNTTNLVAASVSAVVIIGLMATYTQIMAKLYDKQYWLPERMRQRGKTQEDIEIALGKIRSYLKLLTWQGLLFFMSVFLLLFITGVLILKTIDDLFIKYASIGVIIILFFSQVLHAKVFWKSYKKFICSDN
jgi:hypothetical protein